MESLVEILLKGGPLGHLMQRVRWTQSFPVSVRGAWRTFRGFLEFVARFSSPRSVFDEKGMCEICCLRRVPPPSPPASSLPRLIFWRFSFLGSGSAAEGCSSLRMCVPRHKFRQCRQGVSTAGKAKPRPQSILRTPSEIHFGKTASSGATSDTGAPFSEVRVRRKLLRGIPPPGGHSDLPETP